ncbi:unnamed protein product [Adineta steineri]|uniref:Uncharacterized protein n=1 Tax=Adineta steineri TaxID=433720 RepID=A0A815HHA2_9BILA|nr:unnamed protein product [Adineta steineri]
MNKPEWIFILFGCIGCICNGVIQPTMEIVLSKLTTQLTLLIMAFFPLIIAGGFLQSRLITGFASKDKKALENAGKVYSFYIILF